jgi:DNA-binding transcriptional ArsR family regulator
MDQQEAELFKILSVDSRIQIIELLKRRGPMCVCDLATVLSISPSAVSQHLKVLRMAGLVRSERQGYWVTYALNDVALGRCCQKAIKICECECADGDSDGEEPGEVVVCGLGEEGDVMSQLRAKAERLQEELREVKERIEGLEKEQA